MITRILILTLLVLTGFGLNAQFYNGSNMTFGKNRVQYGEFLWLYYKFSDFDTYFYLNGKELAQYAARYANKELPVMESKIESKLDKRLQFIIFNSLSDLKQSNIGLMTETSYNTGGITHIIGSKVFLYFDGNHVNYEGQIRAGIAQVLFNQMMFGGSLGQQVKTSTFFSIPEWYRVGIISYLASDWNVEFDNHVRDGILSGRYKKVNNLKGEDAVYAGHSLWRYIAEQYGNAAVSNIVHMTSVSNSIDKGFLYVIGVPFKTLIQDWREYYTKEYEEFAEVTTKPENLLPIKFKEEIVYGQPNPSPFGKYLAYTTNEMGKYKVYLYDNLKEKKKKILKRGVMIETKTDYSYPLLAWHPTGKMLAIMIEHKGKPWLYLYNLDKKKKLFKKKFARQPIYEVQKITDMSYADNGRFMVMSAVRKGQSDVYVFNIAASSFEKITDDIYSELNPRFINNSSQIVFSSNRVNDTLGTEPEIVDDVPDNFDLFVYDYANRSNILRRITDTPLSNELKPESAGFNTISYLSDANGVFNSYMAAIDSTVSSVDTTINYRYFVHSKPTTNYSLNILDQHSSSRSGKTAFVYFDDNRYKIFRSEIPEFSAVPDLTLDDTRYMASLKMEYQKELAKAEKLQENEEQTGNVEVAELEPTKTQTKMKKFVMVYLDNKGNEVIGGEGVGKGGGEGDFFAGSYGQGVGKFTIPKYQSYRVEYFLNDVISQIDFNYLNYGYQNFTGGGGPIYLNPGFNLFFQFGVNDLMEDHRFVGGVRLNFSLTNNEYLFSYANLKRRLDKEFVFHRNSIEGYISGTPYIGTIHTHELFAILSWPFNEALSLKGTGTLRSDMKVVLATDQISLEYPTTYDNWAGVKGELVFDNTRSPSMNIMYGTRWKIFAEYHQLVNAIDRNLVVVGFDFRKYTRIHRTFIWANRIAGSSSLGNENLIYYMGGVDNWLFPKFDVNTPIDYSQNYAFQTLATNMRGFQQNIRNGNSFVVINSELRFPLFQYFAKTPISSGFLRNFQLVAFGDIGTAWTGPNPYSPENSLFTRYVQSGPLLISVEVQKEPVVGGFGFGGRMHLLGYFIRGDVAWGVEDYKINKPIFYLSLSLDF